MARRMVAKLPTYTSIFYTGKGAARDAMKDFRVAKSFNRMTSIAQTKKGYVVRVGRRNK